MDREFLFSNLKRFGIESGRAFWEEAFSRCLGLVSSEELFRLKETTVAIPGLGGVGGGHLIALVRSGVGRFKLADLDTFEPHNINRQYGAKAASAGRPKLEVMIEEALSINPYLSVERFPQGISPENLDQFLDGVSVVIDGIDFFNFDLRRRLYLEARRRSIPVVVAAPLGFSCAILVFAPDRGLDFDRYFGVREGMDDLEKLASFAVGLAPRPTHLRYMDLSYVDIKAQRGPSSVIACMLCSAMAAMETVRIVLGRPGLKPVPWFHQLDLYRMKIRRGYLFLGNRNPIQRLMIKILIRRFRKTRGARCSTAPISS
ncbi:ThiF family adenylyltransferase [Thermosulfuriphilus sp.]